MDDEKQEDIMENFSKAFNDIIIECYHNMLMLEETKRKYSKRSFSFRDRNAITFLSVADEGKKTISEMAKYLRISRPSATVLIKKLTKYGLVVKFSEPGNERNTMVALTHRGKLFAAYQRRYRKRLISMFSSEFSNEEREILYRGFSRLNDFFIEDINEMSQIHHDGEKHHP